MKKLTRSRIIALLKKHLLTKTAEFYHQTTDTFGDVTDYDKYGEHEIYFSQLLHRYSPYVSLKVTDENTAKKRHTPMALLVSDDGSKIRQGDIVRIEGENYTVSFCENMKQCYYLLSLTAKK